MDEFVTKQKVREALVQLPWSPIEWHKIKIAIAGIPNEDVCRNDHKEKTE